MTGGNLCTALAFAEVSQKKITLQKIEKKEETYFAKKINLKKEENAKIILTGEVTREDEGITVLMAACHQV